MNQIELFGGPSGDIITVDQDGNFHIEPKLIEAFSDQLLDDMKWQSGRWGEYLLGFFAGLFLGLFGSAILAHQLFNELLK